MKTTYLSGAKAATFYLLVFLSAVLTVFTLPASAAVVVDKDGNFNIFSNHSFADAVKFREKYNNGGWGRATRAYSTNQGWRRTNKVSGKYTYSAQPCYEEEESEGFTFLACYSFSQLSNVYYVIRTPQSVSTPGSSKNGQFTVSWPNVPGINKYRLQQQKNNGSWTTIYTGAVRQKSVSNLANGSYKYRVRAEIDSYVGDYRYSSTTTVLLPPPIPSRLTVPTTVVKNGTISISWSSSSTAINYTLQERVNSGAWKTLMTRSSTSFSVSGRHNGTYQYRVRANNASGYKGWKYSANVKVLHPPVVPSSISVPTSTVTNGAIAISWAASSTATKYTLQEKINSGSWKSLTTTSSRSYTASGRNNGTYYYRVRAQNDSGYRNEWRTSSAVVVLHPPKAPSTISVPTSTNKTGSYTISWSSSATTNNYTLQESVNGGSWLTITTRNATSFAVSNRGNGSYRYRVRASNSSGYRNDWRESTTVTVLLPPPTPQDIFVPSGSVSSGKITISWTSSATATEYILQEQRNGSSWKEVNKGNATSARLSGRGNGQYRYQVKACNASDCSGWRSSAVVTVLLPPPTPLSISVPTSVVTNRKFEVQWSESAGAALYRLQQQFNGTGWETVHENISRHFIVPRATDGKYRYRVQACHNLNCSDWRSSSLVTVERVSPTDWKNSTATVVDDAPMSSVGYLAPVNLDAATVKGQASVSGGQASYQIPIDLPPGRAGIQPNVAVSYSSQGGNGVIGRGFSLNAGSSISRCGSTFEHDTMTRSVTFDAATDRLCFNGQRLINISGRYGDGGTIYRTEMDTFVEVEQSNEINDVDSHFTVTFPDGHTATYGASSNSRYKPKGLTTTLTWKITQESYSSGKNTIDYRYLTPVQGEHLLEYIYYTGADGNLGDRFVQFVYESRDDTQVNFIQGGELKYTRRLAEIKTYTGTSRWVSKYQFDYQYSQASGRTLLESIKRCGKYEGNEQCTTETDFNWFDDAAFFELQSAGYHSDSRFNRVFSNERRIEDVIPQGDANGDGVLDFKNFLMDAEGRYAGTPSHTPTNCFLGYVTGQWRCVNVDVNNDGKTDGFYRQSDRLGFRVNGRSILTTVPFRQSRPDAIVNGSDFNGDGYVDIVISRMKNNSFSNREHYLYLHTTDVGNPYINNGILLGESNFNIQMRERNETHMGTSRIEYAGDIDGNGLPDYVRLSSWHSINFSGHSSGDGNIAISRQDITAVYLNHGVNGNVSFTTLDVSEFNEYGGYSLFADVTGDGLPDILDVGNGDIRVNIGGGLFAAKQDGFRLPSFGFQVYSSDGSEMMNSRYLYHTSSMMFSDFDLDGKVELLLPNAVEVPACVDIRENPVGSLRTVVKKVCGNAIHSTKRINIPDQEFGMIETTEPIDSNYLDHNIYRYRSINFDLDSDGELQISSTGTDFIAAANQSVAMDVYGNGLTDIMFTYGSRQPDPERFSYTRFENGSANGTDLQGEPFGVYWYRNYGAGSGQTIYDYQPVDYLQSVTDGFGNRSEWDYRPLTTGEDTQAASQFYELTPEESNDDPEYLHFASSMYTVKSFVQSNAVGGENETQYAYKGAMLNTQGRDFTGFQEIIEKDVRRNITTRSKFNQKFPRIGLLEKQDTSLNQTPISRLVNQWQQNPNHTVNNVEHLFLKQATLQTWDTNGIAMMRKVTLVPSANDDIDEYGNVKKQTVTTTDFIDGEANTDTIEINTQYEPSDGWLNKVIERATTVSVIARDWRNDPINHLDSDKTSSDVERTTTVTYSNWSLIHKKPQTVTTTTSDVTCQRIETQVLNDYGLPSSSVIRSVAGTGAGNGCSVADTRTTSFTYTKNGSSVANDGYFPYTVTNALGHTTTTQQDIGFGQPIHVATKITSDTELVTTTTLDAIGRPVSVTTTGQPTQYRRYLLSNNSGHQPIHGKTYVQTQAMGTPTSEVHLDGLGRELRTVTQGFAGEFRYVDKVYDFHGRLTKTSLPYLDSQSPVYTEFGEFDALDRPTWRRMPHGLESRYAYNGLKTDITVNGSRNMSRTYNSRKWLLETEDAIGGTNRFSYDASGQPLVIEDANGEQIIAYYNGFGHKYKVDDPNSGVTDFKYNTLGELTWQRDANNVQQTNRYDVLGRVYERRIIGGENPHTARYTWDTRKYGMLSTEQANGVTRNYYYDAAARVNQTTITQSGQTFNIKPQYDTNFGRIKGLEYPNGLTLAYEYNDNGYLTHTSNAASGFIYQEVTAMDWAGRITQAQMAESELSLLSLYDTDSNVMLSTQVTSRNGMVHAHSYTTYDDYLNLRYEQNLVTGLVKEYDYDALNRLTNYTFSNNVPSFSQSVLYDYDATGNLLKKTDYSINSSSAYRYGADSACDENQNAGSNAVCMIEKPDNTAVYFNYDNKGNMLTGDGLSMAYNHLDKPLMVERNDSQSPRANSAFTYASDGMRAKQVRTVSNKTTTTYYVDKLYEQDSDGSWRAYIDDIAVLSYTPERKHQLLFTLRDRLGSATTLVDHSGAIVSQRYFDPFGRVEDMGVNHSGLNHVGMIDLDVTNRYRRGFTDHEHLVEQRIVHMNGRVFSPDLGRFLSVDPILQAPTSTQSPNPYSYIMNNPLAGTDPTGYCTASRIEAVCANTPESWGGSMNESRAQVQKDANKLKVVSGAAAHASVSGASPQQVGRIKQLATDIVNAGGLSQLAAQFDDGKQSSTKSPNSPSKDVDPDTGKYSPASGFYPTDDGSVKALNVSSDPNIQLMRDPDGNSYSINLETGVAEFAFSGGNGAATSVAPEMYAIGGIGFFKGGLTTAEGFLVSGVTFKAPFNIQVQRFGAMGISGSNHWGLPIGTSVFANRYFAAIKPSWNPLNVFTKGTIPKGTKVTVGIIGPQGFRYGGGSLQFVLPSSKVINQSTKVVR